ncbi:hypothetical protein ABIB86_000448 [Bradyrhizobium sp. JR1.7]|uniref:hypothetical protein n=1 Tax=unclassified Bradyrhizobium TaxID=2631580 RepID=UPI0033919E27
MRACKRCRYAVPAKDGDGKEFYWCGLLPPRGEVVDNAVQWIRPPMAAAGWCGQWRLSISALFRRQK